MSQYFGYSFGFISWRGFILKSTPSKCWGSTFLFQHSAGQSGYSISGQKGSDDPRYERQGAEACEPG